MSYRDFRDDLAKRMRDIKSERDDQLAQVESLSISDSLKDEARKQIMENFYERIVEIRDMPGYKEAREVHMARRKKEQLCREYEEAVKYTEEKEKDYEKVRKLVEKETEDGIKAKAEEAVEDGELNEVEEIEKPSIIDLGVEKIEGEMGVESGKQALNERVEIEDDNKEESNGEENEPDDVVEEIIKMIPKKKEDEPYSKGNSQNDLNRVKEILDKITDDTLDRFAIGFWMKGWSDLILRNDKLGPVKKELEMWSRGTGKPITKSLRSFMDDYFMEKTEKFVEFRKKLNSEVIFRLEGDYKNFEDSGGDDRTIMGPIVTIVIEKVKNCVKELKPGRVCGEDFYKSCEEVIKILEDYESCFNETNVIEKNKKIIEFVNMLFGLGMIDEWYAKNLFKRSYKKAIQDNNVLDDRIKEDLIKQIDKQSTLKILVENGVMYFYLKLTEDRQKYMQELHDIGFYPKLSGEWLSFCKLKKGKSKK